MRSIHGILDGGTQKETVLLRWEAISEECYMPGMPGAISPSLLHLPHLSLRSTTMMLRLGNAFADFCLGPQSQATLPPLTFSSSSRYPRTIHWHLWNTDSHVSQTNARRHVLGHPFYPMWMHGITISVNIHTSCGGREVSICKESLDFHYSLGLAPWKGAKWTFKFSDYKNRI